MMTLAELLTASCEACDCDNPDCGLMITPRCHPQSGCTVKVFKQTGMLQFECARCERLIEQVMLR